MQQQKPLSIAPVLLDRMVFALSTGASGPHALVHLFRSGGSPFGQRWWLGAFCLLAPPLVAYELIFPKALQNASGKLVLVSALLALVNGPLEEILWRGAYITPRSKREKKASPLLVFILGKSTRFSSLRREARHL